MDRKVKVGDRLVVKGDYPSRSSLVKGDLLVVTSCEDAGFDAKCSNGMPWHFFNYRIGSWFDFADDVEPQPEIKPETYREKLAEKIFINLCVANTYGHSPITEKAFNLSDRFIQELKEQRQNSKPGDNVDISA